MSDRIMNDLLSLSHVPRWVIVPRLKEQTVSDHSFRVAVIYMELGTRLHIPPTLRGIIWSLIHDAGECRSGDIAGKFKDGYIREKEKQATPWITELSERLEDVEFVMTKLADLIETGTWIHVWGRGPHASFCASDSLKIAHQYACDNVVLLGISAPAEVDKLISQLLSETGRIVTGD